MLSGNTKCLRSLWPECELLSFWYSQQWHADNVSVQAMTLSICLIEIFTHSDAELSSSTEYIESDSELLATVTATLDCVLSFITRKINTECDD